MSTASQRETEKRTLSALTCSVASAQSLRLFTESSHCEKMSKVFQVLYCEFRNADSRNFRFWKSSPKRRPSSSPRRRALAMGRSPPSRPGWPGWPGPGSVDFSWRKLVDQLTIKDQSITFHSSHHFTMCFNRLSKSHVNSSYKKKKGNH